MTLTAGYSSWWRIKHDFLHHFHKPRLDLLAWILVKKLIPTYYKKLDQLLHDTGQFCELPSLRKAFKREWKKLANAQMNAQINPKYRPNSLKWVCTCPYFVTSWFLVCKHLVQSVGPVPPIFYLEVKHNRTTPFWSHPVLPQNDPQHPIASSDNVEKLNNDNDNAAAHDDDDDDGDSDLVNTMPGLATIDRETFHERFNKHIKTIRDFCNGLEYQLQFEDD